MTVLDSLQHALAHRYGIESPLGRGGMATVYLAEDRKHDRRVAVKVLNPELAASVGAKRFLREIRIAARLSHPHILPLLDSGDADGLRYYVTPYVPDGSLRERLRREGRLGVAEALRIAKEIGAALDYAHRQGFVHRDVKPENILFADGHAVLADFGVARACCAQGMAPVTEVGLALGTPEYMSPEQASGELDLGSRSDLYSLACVVYEMLAGEPPLGGGNARSTMAKQVTELPRPVRLLRRGSGPLRRHALHRRAALRERQPGSGERVPERRDHGRVDRRAGQRGRPPGRVSHVRIRAQGQAAGCAGHRRLAGRGVGAGGIRAARGRPAPDHGADELDGRRPPDLVRALRPPAGRRVRRPGRVGPHHRGYAARDLVRPPGDAGPAALHRERPGLRPVSQGAPRVEQAHPGRRGRGDRLLRAGDRGGSALRARLFGAGRHLLTGARQPRCAHRRGLRARQAARPEGPGAGRIPGRGACVLGMGVVHLRLGLGRRRPGVSPGHRAESAVCLGPPVVRLLARRARPARRGHHRGPHRVGTRLRVGVHPAECRMAVLLCAAVPASHLPLAARRGHEPARRGELPDARPVASAGRRSRGRRAGAA